MTKSATQIAQETYDRDRKESRLHWMHKTFSEKYAPDDPRERDVFQADLAMLLRETQIDALEPFQKAAALQISQTTVPSVIFKLHSEERQADE